MATNSQVLPCHIALKFASVSVKQGKVVITAEDGYEIPLKHNLRFESEGRPCALVELPNPYGGDSKYVFTTMMGELTTCDFKDGSLIFFPLGYPYG